MRPSLPVKLPVKLMPPNASFGIISPAAPSPSEELLNGKEVLERLGYQVKIFPHACETERGYLAGNDLNRVADLHAAYQDSTVNAILCARGGYGCMRLLPLIDWEILKNNPKPLIGFSDVTALHLAIWQHCERGGFYGPMLTSNLIHAEEKKSLETLQEILQGVTLPFLVPNTDPYHCFQPGVVEGHLLGGNLSLLVHLLGTPYFPNLDGAIVFIEDWRERYYTLDRQFQHLYLSGALDRIAGLILCDFSEIDEEAGISLTEQLRWLTQPIAQKGIPVGYGFSVGHGAFTATLPIGCKARWDAAVGQLTLLASPW